MPVTYVLYLALVAGTLAGTTGWNHPHGETRAMSRAAGIISAFVAAVIVIRSQW